MLKIDFTIEQITALKYHRFHHPHPRVRRKMETLLLKSKGFSHSTIADLVGISRNTVTNYCHQFQSGGIDALQQLNFYQPQSSLEPFRSTLEAHFLEHPVISLNQAKAEIEHLTDISLSPSQIRQFLLKLGLKRRKVGSIPAKADLEKQAAFLHDQLEPRLDEALHGTRQIFLSMPPILS